MIIAYFIYSITPYNYFTRLFKFVKLNNMKTIAKEVENKIIINKSTFITYLIPIQNEEEAKQKINDIKKIHPKATHHCTAYRLINIDRSNDDNEPASTAGLPMLSVLIGNDMINVLAVVVRYFGGILLGKGGLIRAYGSSVSEAIKIAEILEETPVFFYQVNTPFNIMSYIENKLPINCQIIERNYNHNANYIIETTNQKLLEQFLIDGGHLINFKFLNSEIKFIKKQG